MKGIEYELLGAESIEGDKTWTGVKHRFKKKDFPVRMMTKMIDGRSRC